MFLGVKELQTLMNLQFFYSYMELTPGCEKQVSFIDIIHYNKQRVLLIAYDFKIN